MGKSSWAAKGAAPDKRKAGRQLLPMRRKARSLHHASPTNPVLQEQLPSTGFINIKPRRIAYGLFDRSLFPPFDDGRQRKPPFLAAIPIRFFHERAALFEPPVHRLPGYTHQAGKFVETKGLRHRHVEVEPCLKILSLEEARAAADPHYILRPEGPATGHPSTLAVMGGMSSRCAVMMMRHWSSGSF